MGAKVFVQIALECEFMAKTWLYLLLTLSRVGFKEFGDVGLAHFGHKRLSQKLVRNPG